MSAEAKPGRIAIRDANDEDFGAIAAAAARSDLLIGDFGMDRFASMLRWNYASAPSPVRCEFVAETGSEVVAHYGAVPVPYIVAGAAFTAGLASNLFIDHQHRSGMLFLSLQSHFLRSYSQRGVDFGYGLITRANVLEPHLRMGWREMGIAPVFVRPRNFPRIAAAIVKNNLVRRLIDAPLRLAQLAWRWSAGARPTGVAVSRVSSFEPDMDSFLATFMSRQTMSALRTSEILNWRFVGVEQRDYHINVARRGSHVVGYVVTRSMPMKGLTTLAIVDIAFDPADPDAGTALLQQCNREGDERGSDAIAIMLNPTSPFRPLFQRRGFVKTSESFTLVAHTPRGANIPALTANSFADWHLTWFDHDYV